MKNKIILQKGESINFLDYTIRNSTNDDGLVLSKTDRSKAKGYETHLGNYGDGDQESIDNAMMAATLFFMIARPEHFATTVMHRMMGDGGTYHEWYGFRRVLIDEGIEMPDELEAPIGGLNYQVGFNGKRIRWMGRLTDER